jgi:transposase InsO family protein
VALYVAADRSTAQAIRASLLASATITVLRWVRALRPRSQLPNWPLVVASDGSAAQAPWISSVRRYLLPRLVMPSSLGLPPVVACRGTSPAGRPGRERGQLPRITDGGYQRCRIQHADTGDGRQSPCGLIAPGRRDELGLERREDAARHDFAYIEGYYNRQRIHSAIDYITPQQAEAKSA